MAEGTPRDPSQVETSFTAGAMAASIVIGAILGGFVGASDAANHRFGDAAEIAMGIVGAVAGAAIAWFTVRRRLSTANRLKRWCRSHGWTWLGPHAPWGRGVADFESAVRASHVFLAPGHWGDVLARDDESMPALWAIRAPRNNDSRKRIVGHLIVHVAGSCPDTTIVPADRAGLLPKLDGRHRVEFESDDFNRGWKVDSRDAARAFERIDQRTIEYLQSQSLKPMIEFIEQVIVFRFDETDVLSDEGRERCLAWCEGFTRAVPDDLLVGASFIDRP